MIIKPLPSWAIINRFPAFYEGESLTAIEQTARIYGKINELINTYNRFVTENNAELTELEAQVQKDLSCAIRTIINLTDSYITQVELRLGHQDRKLDEAYKSFTTDITETVESLIHQMHASGELDRYILEGLDNLWSKIEELQVSVADEQAALRADYEAAKTSLNAEFNESMQNYDAYFKQLEEKHLGDTYANNYFREHTNQVLVGITSGDGVGYGVPEIGEYAIVGVLLRDGAYCICNVEHHEGGQYYVRGTGYGERYARYDGLYPILRLATVDMSLNSDGDIVAVTAGTIRLIGTESGVEMDKELTGITRIDGLVMNTEMF